MLSDYVTRSELARQIGRDRSTLWRWQEAGLIPAAERRSYKEAVYSAAAARAIAAFAEAA